MRISKSRTLGGVAVIFVCASIIWLWTVTGQAQNGELGAAHPPVAPGQVTVLDELSNAFTTVANNVRPAVVSIQVRQKVKTQGNGSAPSLGDLFGGESPFGDQMPIPPELRDFFGDRLQVPEEFQRQGMGSGVIIDAAKGYVLTNNHVVSDAEEITVTLNDNREFKAKLIGNDKNTDVAVVQIDADNLTEAKLGSSTDLKVGEIVMAIGSPFALGGTVTQGIVSAKDRMTGILGEFGYENFIQTDAAVNPGNSGGPLVNLRGEVVGINTAIATGTGAFAGVSFAVPIDLARTVIQALIEEGKVTRGYLGVEIGPIDQAWARRLNLDSPRGALINSVTPGGAAEKAGLREGDVVVEMNGEKVTDHNRFRYNIGAMMPNTKVNLVVLRDGQRQNIAVTLGERPSDEELAKIHGGPGQFGTPGSPEAEATQFEKLGLSVQTLTPELAERLGATGQKGVVVTEVDPNGPAARKFIRPQMIISRVEKTDVNNVAEFKAAVEQSLKERDSVLLRVWTEGGSRFVLIEPQAAKQE